MDSHTRTHRKGTGIDPTAHHLPGRRRLLLLVISALVALPVVALALGALTVFAFGDLQVTFSTPPPATIRAGTSYSFAVQVLNNGAGGQPPAEAVEFQYRAPLGVVVTSISSSQGPCEVGTSGDPSDPSICSLGNMDPGASATVNITVSVDPSVPSGTQLDNDVRAWQFGTEDDPPDNENHAYVEVTTEADLAITKSARGDNVTGFDSVSQQFTKTQLPDQVTAGELLEYTLNVTNNGPSDAQKVTVVDTLPAPAGPVAVVNFVSADGAACLQDPVDRNKVTCDLGTMPDETSRTIHIVVRVDRSVANGTVIVNTATVSSTTSDPNAANNTATNNTTVNAVADIFITKEDVPAETRWTSPSSPTRLLPAWNIAT